MPKTDTWTLSRLAGALASGATTSRALTEACLARIEDPKGEGARTFVRVDRATALAAADAHDALRKAGAAPSPCAGIPIAIKDLADIQGQVTAAGSKALADTSPAAHDAPVIARLRAAGFVLIGRTNMTEFAYSGLGINPHHGTPLAAWDRPSKRVPGGSSSGSAVAVADRMAQGALGTDTGGSCRIPAAFNGITGFKPTARRVPTSGVVPLSTSLDSIGPLANTVDCCRQLDAVMAGETTGAARGLPLAGLRLHVPETIVLDGLDTHVAADFERALSGLTKSGARFSRGRFAPFDRIAEVNRHGTLSEAESWHWHRGLIEAKREQYDPRVLSRILRGKPLLAADYIEMLAARRRAIAAFEMAMQQWDAILSPTVPIVAPRIADCGPEVEYGRLNMLALRNPMMLNVLDGCSIALPMHAPGGPPTSLLLSGPAMSDARILDIAEAVEGALAARAV